MEKQDKLGSFAGIKFHIENQTWEHGNRLVVHEYPMQDVPFVENLGNKARKITVSAYLVGDDIYTTRDQLLKAVADGEGKLLLPGISELTVLCESCSYSEHPSIRRRVDFSLTFAESGEKRYPDGGADTRSRLTTDAGKLSDYSAARFLSKFNVSGLPSWVADDARAALNSSGLALDLADVSDATSLYESIVGAIPSDFDRATALATNPGITTTAPTTAAKSAMVTNRAALGELITHQSLTSAANALATDTSIQSREDAITKRDKLTDAIDTAQAAPNAPVALLAQLRASVSTDTRDRIARLPQTREFPMPRNHPPICTSYAIYGDASRADEIKQRNNIKTPFRTPTSISALVK